jgi:pantoate--beta-alanine ligase
MIIYKEAADLIEKLENTRQSGKRLGFVPTMGALHEGHIALIKESIKNGNFTVCSIFVNPTQFNDAKDFEKYPANIGNDILLLIQAGCDILFFPSVSGMYPEGTVPVKHYDLGYIEHILEGKYRPGHFQGVCQVVHKLLDIVRPDHLYLGQKDYQQCLVIKRLVQLINQPVSINIVNTVREETGLAMSSRNQRLSDTQRQNAAGIYKMLIYLKTNYKTLPLPDLQKYVTDYLLNNGFDKVDYVAVANAETLQPIDAVIKSERLTALIAAFIGEVRLIDNMVLGD